MSLKYRNKNNWTVNSVDIQCYNRTFSLEYIHIISYSVREWIYAVAEAASTFDDFFRFFALVNIEKK